MAGIATTTSRIILSSGVTVLSSDDPIRVFQRFATLDALSGGSSGDYCVGRGSFTESFPLFGYALEDYQVSVRGETQPSVRTLEGDPGDVVGHDQACAVEPRCFP